MSEPMLRDRVIKELESLARQSDDAAEAEEAVVAFFGPKYETALFGEPPAPERVSELYAYAIERRRQAKRLRHEAAVFKAAVGLLNTQSDTP